MLLATLAIVTAALPAAYSHALRDDTANLDDDYSLGAYRAQRGSSDSLIYRVNR